VKFKEYIDDDKKRLEELLSMSAVVDPTRDAKLKDLKELIVEKLNNPINEGNKKLLFFLPLLIQFCIYTNIWHIG
jgi:hypothetical protein